MSPSYSRPIRHPPADFASLKLSRARQEGREWFRIHPSIHSAIFFCNNPAHRFSHPKCPDKTLYVGLNPETCLWERFGDIIFDTGHALPLALWEAASISKVEVPTLYLCDMANATTRGALTVDLSALMNDDISIPQEWGLAVQQHPTTVPGIKFKSRFTGHACLALFERGGLPGRMRETSLGPINQFEPALQWLEKHQVSLV